MDVCGASFLEKKEFEFLRENMKAVELVRVIVMLLIVDYSGCDSDIVLSYQISSHRTLT